MTPLKFIVLVSLILLKSIESNQLTGEIPTELGFLTQLGKLDLCKLFNDAAIHIVIAEQCI